MKVKTEKEGEKRERREQEKRSGERLDEEEGAKEERVQMHALLILLMLLHVLRGRAGVLERRAKERKKKRERERE
jgi:hypothetical protein